MKKRPLSEINITPFVDVMLVLLIIFMMTAQFLREEIPVNLPKVAKGKTNISQKEKFIIISITKDGKIYIKKRPVSLKELKYKLLSYKRRGRIKVLINADRLVAYGVVVKVISRIRESGISKIGLLTQKG